MITLSCDEACFIRRFHESDITSLLLLLDTRLLPYVVSLVKFKASEIICSYKRVTNIHAQSRYRQSVILLWG